MTTIENAKATSSKDRKSSEKTKTSKGKKTGVKARKALYQNWQRMENTPKYLSARNNAICHATTQKIEAETMDGILLKLDDRYDNKSLSAKMRVVRRIVEKRQAQAVRSKCDRGDNRYVSSVIIANTGRCMNHIRKLRHAC